MDQSRLRVLNTVALAFFVLGAIHVPGHLLADRYAWAALNACCALTGLVSNIACRRHYVGVGRLLFYGGNTALLSILACAVHGTIEIAVYAFPCMAAIPFLTCSLRERTTIAVGVALPVLCWVACVATDFGFSLGMQLPSEDIGMVGLLVVPSALFLQLTQMGYFAYVTDRADRESEAQNAELEVTNLALRTAIRQREQADVELEAAQRRMLEHARQAGVADLARTILHELGNAMNSIGASSGHLGTLAGNSDGRVLKVATMLIDRSAQQLAATPDPSTVGNIEVERVLRLIETSLGRLDANLTDEVESLDSAVKQAKQLLRKVDQIPRSKFHQSCQMTKVIRCAMELAGIDGDEIRTVAASEQRLDLVTDPAALAQVIASLLNNAQAAVRHHPANERSIELTWRMGDDSIAEIDVSDNGTGIAEEFHTKIFRFGYSTSGGQGIGLHRAANLVRTLRGSLRLSASSPGRGTTFRVEIPREPSSVVTPTALAA